LLVVLKEQVREGNGNKQLWVWFRGSYLMYFSLLQITSLTYACAAENVTTVLESP
jgi:hypothetical protein